MPQGRGRVEGSCRGPMQLPAPGRSKIGIQRRPVQRMGEARRRTRLTRPPRHETRPQQCLQRLGGMVDPGDPPGHRQRHRLAHNGQCRRKFPGIWRQLGQPGQDHRRQRPGHWQLPARRGKLRDGKLSQQGPDVQRKAAAVLVQPPDRPRRQGQAGDASHLSHVILAQGTQYDPHAARRVQDQPVPPVGRGARTAGHQQQHPLLGHTPDDAQQRLAGLTIGPVQVLYHHRHRPPASRLSQQREQGPVQQHAGFPRLRSRADPARRTADRPPTPPPRPATPQIRPEAQPPRG